MELEVSPARAVARLCNADVETEAAIQATSAQLSQLIYDGVRYLVLDLGGASYLGSSMALAMLIQLQKLIETDDGVLVLRNPSAQTNELFQITRLSEIFDIRCGPEA
ncbi:MAG: STAS domain-containing protein [Gemmataceae bacterium]|nr:STAS domain-containing protein [Gemmataceae bacterium]